MVWIWLATIVVASWLIGREMHKTENAYGMGYQAGYQDGYRHGTRVYDAGQG